MRITSPRLKQPAVSGQPIRLIPYYLGHFLVYLGCTVVVLVIVWLILKANRLYTNYRQVSQDLARLEMLVKAGTLNASEAELSQWQESISGLAQHTEQLYQEATPFLPLTPYLSRLPIYGDDLQAAVHLVVIGRSLSWTGEVLFETFLPLFKTSAETGQLASLAQIMVNMASIKTELAQVEVTLRQNQAALQQFDSNELSPWIGHRVVQLKHVLPSAISGMHIAQGLPNLFGFEGPRTYLILTQNADELRPAGGYINTAGHIVFDRGQLVQFVMQDSYAVDHLRDEYPYPPKPLYEYMAAEYWVLRDASWSPDFPTAARTAMELYKLGQGVSADGVFALDQHALPHLLKALGPLDVEGEQVTDGNVIQLMRQHWAPEPDQNLDQVWWSQRKSFMLALAEAIRQKFEQNGGTVSLVSLGQALQQALAGKHLLLYLADPTEANFVTEQNWAGALPAGQGDYLMVADANVGFNKTSAAVERVMRYQASLAEDGSLRAEVNLLYHHHAPKRVEICTIDLHYDPIYEQNMQRCYWNYYQFIVPAPAQLISAPNIVVEGRHLLRGQPTSGQIDTIVLNSGKMSWGQLFLLAPQETLSLDYRYTLPPNTARLVDDHWEYSLYLQKQPGTLAPPVEVSLTLPEGAELLNSQPQPLQQQERTFTYQFSLNTDQQITLSYHLP